MAPFVRSASHRVVKNLHWAERSTTNPWPEPKRLRGTKARGLSYQRKVGHELRRCLGSISAGHWFRYHDSNGVCFAQPDFYRECPRVVLVFEAKLTQCRAGEEQIRELYRPLLERVYDKPVVGVLVCKNLIYQPEHLIEGPEAALWTTRQEILTWHWLGRSY